MTDFTFRLVIGIGLLALSVIVRVVSLNRLVCRRMRLSIVFLLAYVGITVFLAQYPVSVEMAARVLSVNRLLLAVAVINLVVVSSVNPLRQDRVPERFPPIVQDTIIITLFVVVATLVMEEKFLTTSAVGAVVIGFALQDTLGNMFSGLAIQVEKPFRIGHWVTVGPHEGCVIEVTWRATKLRTKAGNMVVLPNTFISKEAIINYAEPEAPTRLEVEVGVSYDVPPNQVKTAILDAVRDRPLVLTEPEPEVLIRDFGSSAVIYLVRFWIMDFARDTVARDEVRSAIYYTLRRHRYEIPYPFQVEFLRTEHIERESDRTARFRRILENIDIFAPLDGELMQKLASRTIEQVYGCGERIVRQGEAGSSMFVVSQGQVRVVESSGRELARFDPGGYFGEMSMLAGQPRSASVEAVDDCILLELTAAALKVVVLANPVVLERISAVVSARGADLERQKAEAAAATALEMELPHSLLARIKSFLGISGLLGD